MFAAVCYSQQPFGEYVPGKDAQISSDKLNLENFIMNSQLNEFNSRVIKYRLDSLLVKTYDEYAGEYLDNNMHKFSFNENQQITSEITCFRGVTWYDAIKDEYYYSEEMLLDSTVHFNKNNEWDPIYKTALTYFPDGRLQSKINYSISELGWSPDYKYEFEYHPDTTIQYDYSNQQGNWEIDYKTFQVYIDGLISVETRLTDVNGEFKKNLQFNYEYNNGNLVMKTLTYPDDMNEWQLYPTIKYEYTYDSSNNLARYACSQVIPESTEWLLKFERDNSFDNQYTREDLIIPGTMDELYYRHMLTTTFENNYNSNPAVRSILIPKYNPITIDKVNSVTQSSIKVFPNPSNEYITVNLDSPLKKAEISIFNTTGTLVKKLLIDNNSIIQVTGLNAGLHLFSLTSEGKVIGSGKFVVEK